MPLICCHIRSHDVHISKACQQLILRLQTEATAASTAACIAHRPAAASITRI
jgi:hypothetical protein